MASVNQPIHFGDFIGICQICWEDRNRFGMLVDPNGHTWLVCAGCIRILWDKNQALNQDEAVREEALDKIMDRLRKLLKEDQSG